MPKTYKPKSAPIKRRYRKRAGKSRPTFPRRKFAKKTYGHTHLNVQSKGIMTTYSKDYIPSSKFGKMMEKKYWIGAKNVQVIATPFNILTLDNRQNSFSYTLFSTTDIQTCLANSTFGGSGGLGTIRNTSRFFLNNCNSETLITNNNNFPCEVTCYRMTCKKDTVDTPTTMWTDGLYNSSTQTITDYSLFYGVSPFDSIKLNQYYKIKKITHCTVQAGGTHNARISIDLNRLMNLEYIQESYNGGVAPVVNQLANITTVLLWVVRGYPQQSTATAGSIQTESTSVNFISTEKYTWKVISDANTDFGTYSQVVNYGAAATSSVFNIGSGATVVAGPIV